ncbi:hypothetical protein O4G76_14900 [Limimaricola sp. G21655-S1]|uniref:hypothetical protein n=1 Tax=Limimaricola sp. G21655-S1 TaxID=3014768 RepID=UPI0022AF26FE|nr:hypothetical protein [Limimaricola sp. G21655-S1]MCZ4262132.1 hypothetical protein [Limimaricola sp. G21655-S1]
MTISPSHDQLLRLVTSGSLFFYPHDNGRVWFHLRDKGLEMSGPLIFRWDWNEGPDDRPGLMPIIQIVEDAQTGFHVEGPKPEVECLSALYSALRDRLSPARVLCRHEGSWALTSSGPAANPC